MADEKNNLPDSNSEEKKNTGKKKPDKKLIIGIAAAVAVVAIVVGIIVGVSSGGKEKYTEKPVSTWNSLLMQHRKPYRKRYWQTNVPLNG